MAKRIRSILLCLFLLLALSIPVSATEPEAETEITVRKMEISTPEEFLVFAENCRLDSFSNDLEVCLTNDIDLTGYDFAGVPVFGGVFFGKNHCISGISVTSDGSNQGLFRYLTEDAVVQDLTVDGRIQPGGSKGNVGAIAGNNSGKILNCDFIGSVSGGDCVGGVAGVNGVSGIIENCSAEGSVQGSHFVGGIAGRNYGVIRESVNKAQVNTTSQQNSVEISDITLETITNSEAVNTATDLGGISGINSGVIRACTNYGAVGYRQMGYNIGGIAGTQSGYIVGCTNYGDIQGRKEVGGIVGQMEPVSMVEFSEDTLQILKDQLIAMTGTVNQVSVNAQNNANQITSQIAVLQNQAETAKSAVKMLFPVDDSYQVPDVDTILAAQNTLSTTVQSMTNTVRSIASAADNTVEGLAQDLRTLSSQIGAMGYTLENDYKNLGGSITDVSDLDTSDILTGKLEDCTNAGAVSADLNVGGVAGAIAVENDLDTAQDLEQLGEVSLNFSSEVRAVILNCENSGTVSCNKKNAGGIVGWQSLGLVKLCTSTGHVDATGADYVGGISGASSGFVRECFAYSELRGADYVGGIAGSGTIVTDSLAHVDIEGRERLGGILGWAEPPLSETEDPVSNNYYLTTKTDIGAVDGISYAGQAEALVLNDFLTLADLPAVFKTAKVSFRFADGTMQEVKIPVGGTLDESQIPEIPVKEGFHSHWAGLETADLTNITFDISFEAEYIAYTTVIASTNTRSDGRPILLLEGSFACDGEVYITESDAVPVVEQDRIVIESWEITAQEGGDQVRFLLPDPSVADKVVLYVCGSEGKWRQIAARIDGSYLVFPMETEQLRIVLVQETDDLTLWYVAAATVLAVLIVVITVMVRKKRHTNSQTVENTDA